jgi:hypothetical protein
MEQQDDDVYAILRDSFRSPTAEANLAMSNWWLVAAELVGNFPQLQLEAANSTQVDIGNDLRGASFLEIEAHVPQTVLRILERETRRTFAWLGPTHAGYFLAQDSAWRSISLRGVLEGGPQTLAHVYSRSWPRLLADSSTSVGEQPRTTYAATVYDIAMALSIFAGIGEGATASPSGDASLKVWCINVPESGRDSNPRSIFHRDEILVDLKTGIWRDSHGAALRLVKPWTENLR